jgi:SAM-dependent methyltransferase
MYGIEEERVDGSKLFFAIQTYYALILKMLAAEVASRFYNSAMSSFMEELRKRVAEPGRLREELERLEQGAPMAWYGVRNLLEGQLYRWYLDVWDGEVYKVVKGIVEKLAEFDVESLELNPSHARDVFKVLYEELVPRREVRQKLGIYTTPDWLAELVLDKLGLTVENMLKEGEGDWRKPLQKRVLDPGVGTGTFLVLYIQRLGEYLRRRFGGAVPPEIAREALRLITQNVVGFDIDALALLTARANYLIALASIGVLQHKGDEKNIEIPVYLANSVAPAGYSEGSIGINGQVVPTVVVDTSAGTFVVPRLAAEKMKQAMEELRRLLDGGVPKQRAIDRLKQFLGEAEAVAMADFYDKLLRLKKEGRDSIWISVVESYIMPVIHANTFDYVVGNPPWLTYNHIADKKYQESVIKPLIKDYYRLTMKDELITQMEMAALFLARALDMYLKEGGAVGFVMPRSIFSADQHHNLRTGQTSRLEFTIVEVIDLENVEPLFYVPACAIIAKKGGRTQYPIPATVVSGKLPKDRYKIVGLREAGLRFDQRNLYLVSVGERRAWDYTPLLQIKTGRSYYYESFKNGATIYPRPLFFVDIIDVGEELAIVRSSRRATERKEAKASQLAISQRPVEKAYLYAVLTSNELVPFCYLQPSVAVLPIEPQRRGYVILRPDALRNRGHGHTAQWMEVAQRLWEEYRGEKKERMDIYERLNYQNGLTSQDPSAKYRVVYNTSGEHLTAAIVPVGPLSVTVKMQARDIELELRDTIIDHTLYVAHVDSLEEADYLAAVLNSSVLDMAVKPLQAKGEKGARHFHKKLLEFPIPKYNSESNIHKQLAEFGKTARERVCGRVLKEVLHELGYDERLAERGYLTMQEVGRLRATIRERLRDILIGIDNLIAELLSVKKTNTLLDYT